MSQRITSRPAVPAATRPDIELKPTVNVNTVEALQYEPPYYRDR
ncbi:MAG: hypothetical protein ACR5LD_05070 [Symbiopectobacterium sp.]